ncbi:hypothetical protein ACMFMG_007811 [Clarireedia jacksonii]
MSHQSIRPTPDGPPESPNLSRIEVDILYPASSFAVEKQTEIQHEKEKDKYCSGDIKPKKEHSNPDVMEMSALNYIGIQSPDKFASPMAHNQSHQSSPFPFLSLPLELRLKIYGLLLPARHHKITTQLPHNGYYYTASSIPAHVAQSFYPVSPAKPNKLTTYKILSANSHPNFPQSSIHTAILSVCKQVNVEAERVLYGNCKNVWDFGMSVEAVRWFFSDRSPRARACVKNLKIARDVSSGAEMVKGKKDEVWEELCTFVGREMPSLKSVDLTVWGKGEVAPGPIVVNEATDEEEGEEVDKEKLEEKLKLEKQAREWEYIMKLVGHESLKSAKITWWGFAPGVESFLARWMLDSCHMKEQVLQNGEAVEGIMVLSLDKERSRA